MRCEADTSTEGVDGLYSLGEHDILPAARAARESLGRIALHRHGATRIADGFVSYCRRGCAVLHCVVASYVVVRHWVGGAPQIGSWRDDDDDDHDHDHHHDHDHDHDDDDDLTRLRMPDASFSCIPRFGTFSAALTRRLCCKFDALPTAFGTPTRIWALRLRGAETLPVSRVADSNSPGADVKMSKKNKKMAKIVKQSSKHPENLTNTQKYEKNKT